MICRTPYTLFPDRPRIYASEIAESETAASLAKVAAWERYRLNLSTDPHNSLGDKCQRWGLVIVERALRLRRLMEAS